MKVIALCTQKGGVGKTSSSWCLGSCLRRQGKKVLMIDLDPQRNLSRLMKADTDTEGTSLALLLHVADAVDIIQHTEQGDIIASGKNLQVADLALKDQPKKERLLKESLETVKKEYDFVVIDCPPSLGIATVNALTASNYVVIPVEASGFSLDGLDDIGDTIHQVQMHTNNDLKIAGILLTRYEPTTNLAKAVIDIARELAKGLQTKVFSVPIRNSVRVREAQMLRTDLFEYAGQSNPAKDYEAFTNELLQGMKGE